MPKIYSIEFKDEVVEFYERGHSISETLTEYGISESSLFEWKKDYDWRNPDYIGDVLKAVIPQIILQEICARALTISPLLLQKRKQADAAEAEKAFFPQRAEYILVS